MPGLVGLCSADLRGVANAVNRAQESLIYAEEAGEESWHGTWAEVRLNAVNCEQPYITLPREIARLEMVTLCARPIQVRNQFFEYMQFGNGRMPKQVGRLCGRNFIPQVYTRNNVPTFVDLASTPQYLNVYLTDPADAEKRVLLQGMDQNGQVIYSQDGWNNNTGEWISLRNDVPFVTSLNLFSQITGIQKDLTVGQVQIWQMDPDTAAMTLLVTMEPTETVASYRRYFFDPLPFSCCPNQGTGNTPQTLSVTALAKLELLPVFADTDYLLIQSIEALTNECESNRLGSVDEISAKSQAAERHAQAIRLLNGQLVHYYGLNDPALVFAPFGSAKLEYQRIGSMT